MKGELLRARRICSTEGGFEKAATMMKGYFKERGFNLSDMDKVHKEVSAMDREEVLQYKPKEKSDRVPFAQVFLPLAVQ